MATDIYKFSDGKRCKVGILCGGEFTLCGDAPEEDENSEGREYTLGHGTVNCPRCIRLIETCKSMSRWKARTEFDDDSHD